MMRRLLTPTFEARSSFLRMASQPIASFRSSVRVLEEKKSNDEGTATKKVYDTSFMKSSSFVDEDLTEVDQGFAGAMEPWRPDNWEELLARAEASYPPRGGPRRNKREKREENRRFVIRRQHKVAKRQKIAAHEKRADKIKKELYAMREAYAKYGFAPAMAYAVAAKDASTVGLGGKHGGRLGARYFGPMFRDGTFDPHRKIDGSTSAPLEA